MTGEIAGRVALETARARRRVNGMKAAATRPSGMHSTATAETAATVKATAGMHAATMETSAATMEASATAVKAATTTVEAATAAVKTATAAAVEAAATTAMGACLCRVCEQEPCDRAREDRGERHR